MSDAIDLLRSILGQPNLDDAAIRAILDDALQREVDPLLYCSVERDVPPEQAMQRAAVWLDCPFYRTVPDTLRGQVQPTHLEALADLRVLRLRLANAEVAFTAPDFFGVLRLRQRLLTTPGLRHRLALVPPQALRDYGAAAATDTLMIEARQGLTRKWPYACAQLELTKGARFGFVGVTILLIALILIAPYLSASWLWPLSIVLIGPAMIRLAAVAAPRRRRRRARRPDDSDLPVYSVLIPLRNEAQMVPQLFSGLHRLDYPPDRLDIKFVVEAASPETVEAVRRQLGDTRFSLVVVPDALPRTKPKALDYALPLCRGKHVVVFDAEDVPAADQLWKAAARFAADPALACLQAQLVISNGRQHLLAALFAGEYAGLFGVLLPALARWGLPVPLGGTSNHFDIARLRAIGGWDAFNVTEDADLGARLARLRMKVDVLDSRTMEAAPLKLRPWLGQRTRWMKGWMQTFIVHNRNPVRLVSQMGWRAAIAFELLTLGMITAPLLHCGLALDVMFRLAMGIPLFDGSAAGATYISILVVGYGTTVLMSIQGLLRLRRRHLLVQQALLPLYWLLIAIATVRAMNELLARPFYWFKSPHEPNRVSRNAAWKKLFGDRRRRRSQRPRQRAA